jgi:hypothetical protein
LSSHDYRAPLDFGEKPPFTEIDEIYYKYGPTPRVALQFFCSGELNDYELDVIETANGITSAQLREVVLRANTLDMTAVGHRLCLVRRTELELESSRRNVEVLPISEYVSSLLTARARIFNQAE